MKPAAHQPSPLLDTSFSEAPKKISVLFFKSLPENCCFCPGFAEMEECFFLLSSFFQLFPQARGGTGNTDLMQLHSHQKAVSVILNTFSILKIKHTLSKIQMRNIEITTVKILVSVFHPFSALTYSFPLKHWDYCKSTVLPPDFFPHDHFPKLLKEKQL